MAEARPKDKSWEAQRAALLDKIPNVKLPFQMGPGVTDWVGTREILDQLVPRTNVDMAISSLPLGKLFAMAPDPLKRQMISMLRKGENKARIARKVLEDNPALGKAVESLMLFTGKKGGIPTRSYNMGSLENLSEALDELYLTLRGSARHHKLDTAGLPEVDVHRAGQGEMVSVEKAAERIRDVETRGLPVERRGGVTPQYPMSERNPAERNFYRNTEGFPETPGVTIRSPGGSPAAIDIEDIPELLRRLLAK